MRKILAVAALLAAFAPPTTAVVASSPPPVEAFPPAAPLVVRYDLYFNGVHAADVTETLSIDQNGGYRIESKAAAKGLAKILIGDIYRKSEGDLDDGKFRPNFYEEMRGTKRHYRAQIDREKSIIELRRSDRAETAPLPDAPLVDYLTAAYRSYAAGRALTGELAFTDGRRVKTYRYETGPEEQIETAFGPLLATPVVRAGEKRVIFHVAPALRYLPARVEIETGVGTMLIKIVAIESGGARG